MMVGREVNALFAHRDAARPPARWRSRSKGLTRRGNAQRPARHRARRCLARRCAAARSSASPAWSAPAAPRWRAPSSAPIRSIPAASSSTASRSTIRSPQRRHPPRHRPGAGGPQAAGAVPGARHPHQSVAWRRSTAYRSWGVFVDERAGDARWSRNTASALNIRMAGPDQLVGNLSGGNQQKVVLARWLALRPKVLIVDEPTRGIDVGAKVEVHNLLFEMARCRASPSSPSPRSCRRCWRSATASSPCARAA